MIKSIQKSETAFFLYLTKPIIQLLRVEPVKSQVLLNIENKILYISKIDEEEAAKLENPLVKNITKAGGGYCIFIGKSIFELIDVNPEFDKVDITVENQTLIVKKAP